MKKSVFICLVFSVLSVCSFGQAPLRKGGAQLNAGVGFSDWGVPLYIGFDYAVHPDITLGGVLSYRSYHESWKSYTYNHSITGLAANGNYHFNRILGIPSNWDLYAGLNLGFFMWSSPGAYEGHHSSGLGLGLQVGGRYYFNDKIGINLEFGGGNAFSGGSIGLSFKL